MSRDLNSLGMLAQVMDDWQENSPNNPKQTISIHAFLVDLPRSDVGHHVVPGPDQVCTVPAFLVSCCARVLENLLQAREIDTHTHAFHIQSLNECVCGERGSKKLCCLIMLVEA
jgi:hypothetical protein